MFKKAERTAAKLRVAITGPSGSGKTYSALRLAKGLGKRIAVLDTETGSASLYSDLFEFDVVELRPPFTTERYIEIMKEAERQGYDVLIVDSISHAWAGEGGLLEQKEQLDSRNSKFTFSNWASITKKHEAFKGAILHSSIHLICTMRSKQEYSLSGGDGAGGKGKVEKHGLAPIQRDGMEYEFTTVFDVAMNHEAVASKDRTGLFVDKIFKVTEETGQQFAEWLLSAKPIPPRPKVKCEKCGEDLLLHESRKGFICPNFGKGEGHSKLSLEAYDKKIAEMEKKASEITPETEAVKDIDPTSFSNFSG